MHAVGVSSARARRSHALHAWSIAATALLVASCTMSHRPTEPDTALTDGGADATSSDVLPDAGPALDALDAPSTDAPLPGDDASPCLVDEECIDALWCNGRERCAPGDPAADARGCVRPTRSVCPAPLVCVEEGTLCLTECDIAGDRDADGHRNVECWGGDCDDDDAAVHPGAAERACDDVDQDCDGLSDDGEPFWWYPDVDADGFGSAASGAPVGSCEPIPGRSLSDDDCADDDATVHPGAAEVCDAIDTDCNYRYEGAGEDDDGDGRPDVSCGGWDCDDTSAAIHPGAREVLCNGIDEDCDGHLPEDYDEDGERATYCGGHDCNDRDPSVGEADGDADADGHLASRCGGDDCDDTRAARHAGALEICDRLDNACTGVDRLAEDLDDDGYAPLDATCRDDVLGARPATDCDDGAPSIRPGAADRCDGLDNDCDLSTADGSAPNNGCLVGHACADGACRQVASIAAHDARSCAILTDRSVRCWGWVYGCAGRDVDGGCWEPFDAFGWRDVVAIAPNLHYALESSGRVVDDSGRDVVLAPPGIAVTSNACVVRADSGAVWCAGRDLPGPRGVIQVDDGDGHTCAVTSGGELWCWGSNYAGQLGDGTTVSRDEPVRVTFADVVDVAATGQRTCAVRSDGTVWCWGDNSAGILGTVETSVRVLAPSLVPGVTDARAIGAAHRTPAGTTYFLVTRSPRAAVAFACTAYACPGRTVPGPGEIPGTEDALEVAAATGHSCTLTTDGRVECFGLDRNGRLGWPYLEPGAPPRPQPLTVGGL